MKTEVLLHSIGKISDDLIAEAEAEANANRKPGWVKFVLLAACLALVVCLGLAMPGWTAQPAAAGGTSVPGAASLVAEHAALGYILMGLLCFLLGVTVTVLLFRLRRRVEDRERDRRDGEDRDEL